MKKEISVHHEWGKLKEVMVGIGDDIVVPTYYEGLGFFDQRAIEFMKQYGGSKLSDADPKTQRIVLEQVSGLVKILEDRGITVHRCHLLRPEEKKYLEDVQKGHLLLFPRDPIVVIGNNVIELSLRFPMRRKERWSLRPVLESVLKESNANYVAMPPASPQLDESGPFLEGGDILLNGYEIYVGHSGWTSNRAGIEWLRKFLGPRYSVHEIRLNRAFQHLDCVLALLRPRLGIMCPEGFVDELPESLRNWEYVTVTKEEAENLGANALVLDEKTVIIDERHHRIGGDLQARGQEVIEVPFGRVSVYGGALRCWHHPLIRDSKLS